MKLEITIPDNKIAKVKEIINNQFPETVGMTNAQTKVWLEDYYFEQLKHQIKGWNFSDDEKEARDIYNEAISHVEEVL